MISVVLLVFEEGRVMSLQSDIQDVRKGDSKGGVSFVEVEVQKSLTDSSFIVADRREHIVLDVSANPQQTAGLAVGRGYRLLMPRIVGDFLVFGEQFKAGHMLHVLVKR